MRIIHISDDITVNKHYIFYCVKSESETSAESNSSVAANAAASVTGHDSWVAGGVRGASGIHHCRGRGRGRG